MKAYMLAIAIVFGSLSLLVAGSIGLVLLAERFGAYILLIPVILVVLGWLWMMVEMVVEMVADEFR